MNLELEGKTALDTGASQGLGYACALALAQEGVRVALCAGVRRDLLGSSLDPSRIRLEHLAVGTERARQVHRHRECRGRNGAWAACADAGRRQHAAMAEAGSYVC